jgi:branched-chain amino acid transport system substrate-binding protein
MPPWSGGLLAAVRRNRCQRLGGEGATLIARLAPVPVVLLMAAALAACSGGSAPVSRVPAPSSKHHVQPFVDIYAGLPLNGALAKEGRAVEAGVQLACHYAHTRPGGIAIHCKYLNNSGRKTGADNLSLTLANASRVAVQPHAVYYIGDLSSAATTVSLSVLNAAGIAQVTPGDPFIAAPSTQSGADALAPKLLGLLPTYTAQAAADMLFFKKIPPTLRAPACTRVLAVSQGDPESNALVAKMYTDAPGDGITMPKPMILTGKSDSLTSAQTATLEHQSPAPCGFAIAGSTTKPAVGLTKLIHMMYPHALIVGTSGLCNARWTKGISAVADPLLWCTSPVLKLDQYEDANDFIDLYRSAHHGHRPGPYALYGYEAADLGIEVIDNLGASGDNREMVREDLFDSQVRDQVFPEYAFLANGDSRLASYGLYRVDPTTLKPVYDTRLTP